MDFDGLRTFFNELPGVIDEWARVIVSIHKYEGLNLNAFDDAYQILEDAENQLMSLVDMDDFFDFVCSMRI